MCIDFVRPKRGKNQAHDQPRGRLCVGWRNQDWTKVWYEPISTAQGEDERNKVDEEGAADLGLFRFDNPHGPPGYREPMEGEVRWYPHYDPAKFDSTRKKERELMQKRFLNDAHKYLAEIDPDAVAEMEESLRDDKHRKWASWFEMAQKWKRTEMKTRRRRVRGAAQGTRRPVFKPGNLGKDDSSDSSDDSGYHDDGAEGVPQRPMGPPPKPSSGGGKRRAGGSQSNGNSPASKKTRHSSNGTGFFVSGRTESASPSLLMTGGRGSLGASRPRTIAGSSINGEEDDEDDDDTSSAMFDAHHPTPEPDLSSRLRASIGPGGIGSASILGRNGLNALPTPLSLQRRSGMTNGSPRALSARRERSQTPSGDPRPKPNDDIDWWAEGAKGGKRLGAASLQADDEQKLHGPFANGSARNSVDLDQEPDNQVGGEHDLNVGLTDEEAMERALRASVAPPDDDDLHVQRAISASLEHNEGRPNGVHPSIEPDDNGDGD